MYRGRPGRTYRGGRGGGGRGGGGRGGQFGAVRGGRVEIGPAEDASTGSGRADRLHRRFHAVLQGNDNISSKKDVDIFYEAARLQTSPSICVEMIISGPAGLTAIGECVRIDLSSEFICRKTLPFIQYLADPAVKVRGDGVFLRRIIKSIVEPPALWRELNSMYHNDKLEGDNLDTFAWLSMELISLPVQERQVFVVDVQRVMTRQTLLTAALHSTRELGYRIQKVLRMTSQVDEGDDEGSPGGRHDNDFADFRQISIYPTRDEFLSTIRPFYRSAAGVAASDMAVRARLHIDNQFRLLREDMIAEMREDVQIATGKKSGEEGLD